jgi:hypothetical protein
MKHLRHIFLVAMLVVRISGHTQTNSLGATNIPHNKQFEWNHVSTKSFDVNYYTDDAVMAGVVGKMAEEALWDISKTLDYENRARFAFYLFLNFNDLVYSNSYPRPNFKENGVTPLRMNYANLVFPGSYDELFSNVRSEVIRLLMEDYYYGGPIQLSIQSNLLLYLPEWFADGFPSYMGEGWDYEDEMWLSSLENSPLLTYAVDGQGTINRTLRKSIWYYIAQNYGQEKLGEIFYMTRLTRSVEDGIIHVLGITLKTLTEKWREFILQSISENASFREPIDKESIQADFGSKSEVLSFALNPVQPTAAVYLNREGKQRVLIYNFQNGKYQETPIVGGIRSEQFSNFRFEMPMAWSPDGIQLVTTVYDKADEYLAWYDMEEESVKFVRFQPDLDRILQIAWNPSGNNLVCSGLRMGQIDLFEFAPLTGKFTQLTHDFHDDLFPVYSDDGERIYHASTRTMMEQKESPLRFDANGVGFDIWAYSHRGQSLSQVTRTPSLDEFPVAMYSSFELLVRSDQTGIYNLQKVNAFLGESSIQTNMVPGTFRADLSDSLIAYTTPEREVLTVNVAPRMSVLHDQLATRTSLRQSKDKAAALKKLKMENASKMDSVRSSGNNLANPKEPDLHEGEQPDTAKANANPVKYYVFDDDDGPDRSKPHKRPSKATSDYLAKAETKRPDFDTVAINSPSATRTAWSADRVMTRIGYDPVFRMSFIGEVRIRDHQGNHQILIGFQPYMDLRSSETYVRYMNQKHSLDYQIGLSRSGRFLNRSGLSARYNWTQLDATFVLPLSRYLSIAAGGHFAYIDRKNMQLLFPREIDGHTFMTGGRLNLTYDRTLGSGDFVMAGTSAMFDLSNAHSLTNASDNFITGRFDFRKYVPLKRVVLAGRVAAAWSQGSSPQQFFLGGTPDALLSRFANIADYPIESPSLPALRYMEFVTPVRGFQFNARNGTKFVVANAELRIPISRILLNSLNSNPAYNVELIPFFDLGSTWSQGNPLSQKNPINTQTINSYPLTITVQTLKSPFLMGFGTGTRFQIFGYAMRFDLAWGVDDYTVQTPRLHLSLGKNF